MAPQSEGAGLQGPAEVHTAVAIRHRRHSQDSVHSRRHSHDSQTRHHGIRGDDEPQQTSPSQSEAVDTVAELRLRDNHNVWQEFKVVFKLALPTIIQTASQQAMAFTDQIFVGHLGTDEMAAAALANTYAAFLTFFLFGVATALDTLGSQAYGAARSGNKGITLTTWTFTSLVVLTAMCVPVTVGLALGYQVARGILRQDPYISRLIAEFCDGLIAGVWPLVWSLVLMKYFQVQNVMTTPAVVAAATFGLNIASNFIFIDAFGFKGAPWATSFSRFVQFFALVAMVWYFEYTRDPRKRGWFARLVFHDRHDDMIPPSKPTESNRSLPALPAPSASTVSHSYDHIHVNGAYDPHISQSQIHSTDTTHRPSSTAIETDTTVRQVNGHGAVGGLEVEAVSVYPAAGQPEPFHERSVRQVVGGVWGHVKAACKWNLLWMFLKLGLPGGVMMACEQGSFDVTTALAGQLGTTVVAAHSIMLNIVALTFLSCPFAVGIAGSIRVGNLLGEGLHRTARKAGWLCVAIGGAFMAVCALLIGVLHDHIGKIFTSDPEVLAIAASLWPMVVLFQVSDGVMGTAQGVLRGCGRQRILMVYNIIGFWLCGVLVGYLLCFHADLGVQGLWWGIASGDTTTAIMNVVTLLLVNWRKESDKALKNMAVHNYTPRTHPHEDTFPVALETASLRQTHMQTANGTAGLDGLHHAIDAAEQGVKPGVQQGPGLGVAAITRSASPASVVAAEAAAVALEERTALLQGETASSTPAAGRSPKAGVGMLSAFTKYSHSRPASHKAGSTYSRVSAPASQSPPYSRKASDQTLGQGAVAGAGHSTVIEVGASAVSTGHA